MHTAATPTDARMQEINLQKCLDALASGRCTEDEFLSDTIDALDPEANSAWDVLSHVDQRYRRGQLAEPIFQSIKQRIARHALHGTRDGVTIELVPVRSFAAHSGDRNHTDVLVPAPAGGAPDIPKAARPAVRMGEILRNRYVIESFLGRGGMGDVFKATDGLGPLRAGFPPHVAVKVFRESVERRPEFMARLQREFESTRKLSHPNVVKVYEFDCNDEFAFYTMELLEGENVGDMLAGRDRRPLPAFSAWSIIGAVGAALVHAHSRGVIHGDVSPKNVMLTPKGEVRVLDFGSSTMSPPLQSAAAAAVKSAIAATPAYASCELLEGLAADPRDDLYALACLAYELLTGEHPFQGRRATEARDMDLRPQRPAELSLSRWRTIQRGLAWTREERSLSVRQWLRELGLEPETDAEPAAPVTAHRASAARRSSKLPARTAGLALGIIVLAILFAVRHRPSLTNGASAPPAAGAPSAPAESAASRPVETVVAEPHAAPEAPPRAVLAADPTPGHPSVASREDAAVPAKRGAATGISLSASPAAPSLRFTFNRYSARPGAHFVETRVWRSHASTDARQFVWWTADASAQGGIDFVPQAPTPHIFSQGRQLASLFIRLLPNAGRRRNADFRICLGRGAAGSTLSDIRCSTVLIPASSDRRT